MEITPEQKALIEYGKARGRLEGRREEFIIADIVFGISKQEAIASFRKHHPIRSALVKDAWQKRAVCRAWLPPEERECANCKYDKLLRNKYPCSYCFPNDWENPLWEPRKEGG